MYYVRKFHHTTKGLNLDEFVKVQINIQPFKEISVSATKIYPSAPLEQVTIFEQNLEKKICIL